MAAHNDEYRINFGIDYTQHIYLVNMGYAGYFSTTARLKEKPNDLQAALARIPLQNSLQILEKLSYNVAVMPKEAKYRKIKLQNPKIKEAVADVEGALSALLLMGWEKVQDATDGEILILPEKKIVTMAQVRDIQTAQQDLTRKEKDLKRSASAASLKSKGGEQDRVRLAVEADKLNRA